MEVLFMKIINYRLIRLLQLFIVLILTILIFKLIWQVIIIRTDIQAKEYKSLAAIPPELIINLQKVNPNNWQDYAALLIANEIINSDLSADRSDSILNKDVFKRNYGDNNTLILSSNHIIQLFLSQLGNNIKFKELDWKNVDPELRKMANYYRQLFEKYPIFEPGKYFFPLAQPCYYVDTFGAAREGGARKHEGTDLFADKGTPIFSVCSGKVERLGWNRLGGERVGVRGEDGNYYYYAHLDTINKDLSLGAVIKPGDLLGTMGNTGDALTTPDHLHFGIELLNGEWLNPYSFLKVWEYHKFKQER
jgi:murein DD-endopeptidase MepM/ murein hydrolase activator NlpD